MTARALAGIHEVAAARRDLYGLLSRLLLAPPAEADRAALMEPALLEELAAVYGAAAAPWVRAAAARDDRRERQDFMDLLASPTGKFVQPWESVYRDEQVTDEEGRTARLLCGPSARAVACAYRRAGVDYVPSGLADLPDNAGVELGFLSNLCERQRAAADAGQLAEAEALVEHQRQFVEDHAGRWFPVLGDALATRAETDLYRGVGAMLRALIEAEQRPLDGDLAPDGER